MLLPFTDQLTRGILDLFLALPNQTLHKYWSWRSKVVQSMPTGECSLLLLQLSLTILTAGTSKVHNSDNHFTPTKKDPLVHPTFTKCVFLAWSCHCLDDCLCPVVRWSRRLIWRLAILRTAVPSVLATGEALIYVGRGSTGHQGSRSPSYSSSRERAVGKGLLCANLPLECGEGAASHQVHSKRSPLLTRASGQRLFPLTSLVTLRPVFQLASTVSPSVYMCNTATAIL